MLSVRRLVLGVPLVAMLISTASGEAKAGVLTDPAGPLLSLLETVESRLAAVWLEPTDIKTIITVWPGLLRDAGGSKDSLVLPDPLTTMPPYQADCEGRFIRFITLQEAIALALEHGPIDRQSEILDVECQVGIPQPQAFDSYEPPPCKNYALHVDGRSFTRGSAIANRIAFERNVQLMRLNVEQAYWNLQFSYLNLYAQEQGVRVAYKTWMLAKLKYVFGSGVIADVTQARGQYESFRALRIVAVNDVLDQERILRGLLDMTGDDDARLVPSDRPTLAEVRLDWESVEAQALAARPEILLGREIVQVARTFRIVRKHFEECLASFGFTETPDPESPALPQLRPPPPPDPPKSRELLARAYETLVYEEWKTISFLKRQYRRIPLNFELIRIEREACQAFAGRVEMSFEKYEAGTIPLDELLEAQRFWCNGFSQEELAVRDYNNALAQFEYAKGSILDRHPVVTVEGTGSAAP